MPCLTCEQRACENSIKDLWAMKKNTKENWIINRTIQYVEPWRKRDCAYGKGVLLIWSFTLEAGIGRVAVGRCWLMLIADGCYWLLLVAGWLLVAAGILLVAAGIPLQAKKSLKNSRILMICGWDNFAGEKVFEYFQDIVDLRVRKFCRRKCLWIFSGQWWFESKTILQPKKSLNIFGIKNICG